MNGFWQSFPPVIHKFGLEIVFIAVALIVILFSLLGYENRMSDQKQISPQKITMPTQEQNNCYVDISGAVIKPNVYKLSCNKRLMDALSLAGGLSEESDKPFIARNFNFARYIFDQEKIHIPFTWEINEKIFLENKRTIDFTSPQNNENQIQETNDKISIGLSSAEELEVLPGIGKATAQKIVDNRPYGSINDLVTKKIVSKTVFEKIKSYIIE